jgi:hypothetical protein
MILNPSVSSYIYSDALVFTSRVSREGILRLFVRMIEVEALLVEEESLVYIPCHRGRRPM